MKQTLKEMVSSRCYDEIIGNIKKKVGEYLAQAITPSVIKAIEEGNAKQRDHILCDWLECDSCRVCTECGAIMEDGYYLAGYYACSDACRNNNYKRTCGCKTDKEAERLFLLDCYDLNEREVRGMTNEEIQKANINKDVSDSVYYTEWY